jgi:hypothetical protein
MIPTGSHWDTKKKNHWSRNGHSPRQIILYSDMETIIAEHRHVTETKLILSQVIIQILHCVISY